MLGCGYFCEDFQLNVEYILDGAFDYDFFFGLFGSAGPVALDLVLLAHHAHHTFLFLGLFNDGDFFLDGLLLLPGVAEVDDMLVAIGKVCLLYTSPSPRDRG